MTNMVYAKYGVWYMRSYKKLTLYLKYLASLFGRSALVYFLTTLYVNYRIHAQSHTDTRHAHTHTTVNQTAETKNKENVCVICHG